MSPKVELTYSSAAGPSPYGYGWNLALARVRRSLKNGVPRYTEDDAMVLEINGGLIELVPVPGQSQRYQAKVEGSHFRIGFDDQQNYWKVIDRTGTSFYFGRSRKARVGSGPDPDQTYAWLLERTEDLAGNTIDFAYQNEGGYAVMPGLPVLMEYGGNPRQRLRHFNTVRLAWDPLPYPTETVISFTTGQRETLNQRLARVDTYASGLPARRYTLTHSIDPVSGHSTLAGVTLNGFAQSPADDVQQPSTVFHYSPSVQTGWPTAADDSDRRANAILVENVGFLRDDGDRIDFDVFDINGDAIVDAVRPRDDPPSVRLGNGSGFASPTPWPWPHDSSAAEAPLWIRRTDSHGDVTTNIFDIDGDSLPDLVDARTEACGQSNPRIWCVYRNTGSGFDQEPLLWSAPAENLRQTDDNGAKVKVDVVDLNGDGRPDWVNARSYSKDDADPHWEVHWNTGDGFDPEPTHFRAHSDFVTRSSESRTVYGVYDMNGDGLRDFVAADRGSIDARTVWRSEYWNVYFNTGTGFLPEPHAWRVEKNGNRLPNFVSTANDGGRSVVADLIDLTGDGRPDLIRRNFSSDPQETGIPDRCSSSCGWVDADSDTPANEWCCYNLLLYVNTGSSFAAPVVWRSTTSGPRADYDRCPYGTIACLSSPLIAFDYFDFDGDGLVDLVEQSQYPTYAGQIRVFLNPASPRATGSATAPGVRVRPNLLVAMKNGIGGETHIEYKSASLSRDYRGARPLWVVTRRETYDGIHAEPAYATTFAYAGGRFDRGAREFRGFAIVWEVDELGVTRATEFHQDKIRAGLVRRVSVLGPPTCRAEDPLSSADPCSPWNFLIGRENYTWDPRAPIRLLRHASTPYSEGRPVNAMKTVREFEYDAYGNRTLDKRSTSLAAAYLTATSYHHQIQDEDNMPGVYRVDRPTHTTTWEEGHRGSPLLEKRFAYDWTRAARGALTATAICLRWRDGACSRWSSRGLSHDEFGNVYRTLSPLGPRSQTIYDNRHLFAVGAVDPSGHRTSARQDPRSGRVTHTTTISGNRLGTDYDGLGRAVRTWGPGHSPRSPLETTRYVDGIPDGDPGYVVQTRKGVAPTVTFVDGLGREIGQKTIREIGPDAATVVSGLKRYGSGGHVTAEALPFIAPNASLDRLQASFADAPAWIRYEYDSAGRHTATISPDGSRTSFNRSAPGILVSADANTNAAEGTGSIAIRISDGFGRRIQEDLCARLPTTDSPFLCPAGSLLSRQMIFYDGLDRIVETRVVATDRATGRDSFTRHTYDGAGNRVRTEDSDTGTWRYFYDAAGQRTRTISPRGGVIQEKYDASGRVSQRRAGTHRVTYRYHRDGGGTGKVRRIVTRDAGARVVKDFEYDTRGRLVSESRSFRLPNRTRAEHSIRYGYDNTDRRTWVEYPTDTGTEGERITTGYSRYGYTTSLHSPRAIYVSYASYDLFGNLTRIDYGNGISDRYDYGTPDTANEDAGALRCIRTTAIDATGDACAADPSDYRALGYADYDPNGNLREIIDRRYAPPDRLHEGRLFRYDPLGRLNQLRNGDGTTQAFAYDSLGNLTQRGRDRLYYDAPRRPHQLTYIEHESLNPVTWSTVEHDANGNRTRNGRWRYAYDRLNRLHTILRDDDVVAEYYYDETGARVAAVDADSGRTRIYFDNWFWTDGSVLARTFLLGDRIVATDTIPLPERRSTAKWAFAGRAKAQPEGIQPRETVFLHTDHQRSATLFTDDTGRALQFARYRPYGSERGRYAGDGTAMSNPATSVGYTGHPVDPTRSGLLFMGARYYDPYSASFLTPDPSRQYFSPYAYAGGNPVVGRDPDGRIFGLTALQLVMALAGTATFIDTLADTGNLGGALTAGVSAGMSVYASHSLASQLAAPLRGHVPVWARYAAAAASDGFAIRDGLSSIDEGRVAGGIASLSILAASFMGVEAASPIDPNDATVDSYSRQGIEVVDGADHRRTIYSDGICATEPGCVTNVFKALRENLRQLFYGRVGCVQGCDTVFSLAETELSKGKDVHLQCNSHGAIKCLGALQRLAETSSIDQTQMRGTLTAELTGAPLLRPPRMKGVTYHVNLFDPVTWVGAVYATPFRSDVVLGRSWWVPMPVVVHHSDLYQRSVHEFLSGAGH